MDQYFYLEKAADLHRRKNNIRALTK